MDKTTKDILHFLSTQKDQMIAELYRFCEINSGSENLLGLAQMTQVLKRSFEPLADQIEEKEFQAISNFSMTGESKLTTCGNALFIRKRPELKRRILLCGHMDTVYSAKHPFQKLNLINENEINGPGVADMKGGLVVILYALTSFEKMSLARNLGWDLLINADEEIGSPASAALIKELAPNYQAALVYEPAMTLSGNLAKNRRGSGKFTLIARGKSAHVGRAFTEGRNAISYLSEAVLSINALNQLREGVTINVGRIAGGDALNMVPDLAVAQLDIRISKSEDESWVKEQLDSIILKLKREGYSLILQGQFNRPIKAINPPTEHLFKRIQKHAQDLGLSLDWQDSGGCCDGNNLAQFGLPVIDTLGVRGGNIHSPQEFILIDSLVERAALSTLLLQDLAGTGLEELRR